MLGNAQVNRTQLSSPQEMALPMPATRQTGGDAPVPPPPSSLSSPLSSSTVSPYF